uniref:Uncharacterized protein n=1 Tax=Globisporangium ultimum (strain ATCC 200006 / CBS 805.95 / DAOM BR144) TaxID=431595 RepID=K3WJ40_GLOUD
MGTTLVTLFVVLTVFASYKAVVVSAQDTAICSTVTCIANGESSCNRATDKCPVCMYAISGGYSCYDKISGECPYPDLLLVCPPKSTLTLAPATVAPPNIVDASSPTSATPSVTPAPATTTTITPATTSVAPETAAKSPNSIQNNPTSSGSTVTSGTTNGASTTDKSATGTSSRTPSSGSTLSGAPSITPAVSPNETTSLDSSNGVSTKSVRMSSQYVNVAVIAAAVIGTMLVGVFVMRRMKQRRDLDGLKTPEDSNKQFNLQVDGRGATPGYMTAPVSRGRAGSRAAGTSRREHNLSSHSDLPSQLSMASLTSSTVEFANSQYGYPSDASSLYASRTVASSAIGYNAARPRQQSVLKEDEEYNQQQPRSNRMQSMGTAAQPHSNRTQSNEAQAPPRPPHQPVYQGVRRKSSAVSLTSGNTYEDEYDIVVPGTLRDADRRNTETLVMDGRFGQISNFSEQDVQTMHDDRFFAKEHEI